VTGRASGLWKKTKCWFVNGNISTLLITPVIRTTPPSPLASIISRTETFWHQLTQVHLENGDKVLIPMNTILTVSTEYQTTKLRKQKTTRSFKCLQQILTTQDYARSKQLPTAVTSAAYINKHNFHLID